MNDQQNSIKKLEEQEAFKKSDTAWDIYQEAERAGMCYEEIKEKERAWIIAYHRWMSLL